MEKNHPMVPPLLISCHNNQCIETIIFCKLDHFCAALWIKRIIPPQNHDFEKGKFFSLECHTKVVKLQKMSVLMH